MVANNDIEQRTEMNKILDKGFKRGRKLGLLSIAPVLGGRQWTKVPDVFVAQIIRNMNS